MASESSMRLGREDVIRSITNHLFNKVAEGDELIDNLNEHEQLELKSKDPWRNFSPYTEKNLTQEHLSFYYTQLVRAFHDFPTSSVVSLILLDRLLGKTNVILCTANVFPLITSSFLVAHKSLVDFRLTLKHFNVFLPFLLVKHLRIMEKMFLQSVNYRLVVDGGVYGQYLMALVETWAQSSNED
eukprot:TRINITY_DN3113_c0_g1_i1.p1 TRINITY_DN3113_c0_g1~~TRINITY_DN3113_c0_g1_i1.p1  ORF type:complete len:185 (+),score=11.80 TRINITY_DN3113_c0_g1_i1:138-692(+)